jgi:hypothetical protein
MLQVAQLTSEQVLDVPQVANWGVMVGVEVVEGSTDSGKQRQQQRARGTGQVWMARRVVHLSCSGHAMVRQLMEQMPVSTQD